MTFLVHLSFQFEQIRTFSFLHDQPELIHTTPHVNNWRHVLETKVCELLQGIPTKKLNFLSLVFQIIFKIRQVPKFVHDFSVVLTNGFEIGV